MNIRYETIRRVIITYPKENEKTGEKAVKWCYQNGYHIKEIGYTRGMKKRKLIAEKVIRKERESGKLKTYIFVSNGMYGGGIIVVKAKSRKEAWRMRKNEI
ncbi:MAG: hypothetical protein J7L80_02940 [Thermoplasmata archaeon]|nr:hypothetical protein [Thermoplasmata archaeon]